MLMNKEQSKTVIFQPDGSVDTFKQESVVSTSARLQNYNEQLKDSLNSGIAFTELLDRLINTSDPHELLDSAMQLISYRLNSAFLVFPQQYSRSDFYLIFLSRLLQQHNSDQLILQSSEHNHELYQEFPGINNQGYFVFQVDPVNEGGAYYVEKQNGAQLFYLNFAKHIVKFNAAAITSLLVENYHEKF